MSTLPNISPEIIKAYHDQISKTSSVSTIKRKESSLSNFFAWAKNQGHIQSNPMESFEQQAPETQVKITPKNIFRLGFAVAIVVLIFLLVGKVQIPIPFIKTPASDQAGLPESNIQTTNVTQPTILSPWTIYSKFNLKSVDGEPVSSSQDIVFKIYDDPNNSTALWSSEAKTLNPDSEGNISIYLDDVPTDIFFENDRLYLGLSSTSSDSNNFGFVPISSANSASNLQGYTPASQEGAVAGTIPVISSDGSLLLADQSPSVKATQGNLLIQGQALTLSTPNGSDGDIEINPDGKGIVHFLFEGTGQNYLNAQAPNMSSGSLYYGVVANNSTGTGYNLLNLQSGSTPTTKFSVDGMGNTFIDGKLTVDNDINITGGGLQIAGVTRLSSLGRLSSITGYYQDSGIFEIDQGGPDYADISKILTSSTGASTANVLTLKLDESALATGSGSDTLVLQRLGGTTDALALLVDDGNARFDGQVQLGRYTSNPSAIGEGSMIYNTTSDKVYVYDGSTWQEVGTSSMSFDAITSATNTTAAMVVGTGASLTYSGTGTINASSLIGGTWAAPGTIGSTTPNSGAFTTLSANSTVNFSGLTASKVVFTDASKDLTSTGTVGVDQGGTGISSYTVGDLIYASGATTLSSLNDVATGNALISGGVGVAPSWGKIELGTHTTGNYVSTITGTANQIDVSGATGDVTLSVPSDFRAPGTVNAVSGLYTGATAGTQRIDASGNLVNIGTTQLNSQTYTWPGSQTADGFLKTDGVGGLSWTTTIPATSVPFSGITSATNTTAAMVVGTGASLTYSGTGTINASSLESLTASQFLRSDTSDSFTSGTLTTDAATTLDVNGNISIADTDIVFDGASTQFTTTGDLTIDAGGGDINLGAGDNLNITAATNLIFGGVTSLGETTAAGDSGAFLVGTFDEFDYSDSPNVQGVLNDIDSTIAGIIGGTTGIWTDAGTYLYPTAGEVLGNSASAGANKIAGLYLADSAPLYFGTDNDINYTFSGTTLAVTTGTNDINFDANTLFIDGSADNVGIGTAGPTQKLDVLGNSVTSGNVGIGIPSAYISAPRVKLDVQGTVSSATPETLLRLVRQRDSGVTYASGIDLSVYRYELPPSGFNARTQLDFILNNGGTDVPDTTVMSLRSNGDVGIGTTSPGSSLHVNKSASLIGTLQEVGRFEFKDTGDFSGGEGGYISLYGTDDAAGREYGRISWEVPDGGAENKGLLGLWVSDSTATIQKRMVIDNTGNVGIGTTGPNQLLHLSSADPRLRFTDSTLGNYSDIYVGDVGAIVLSADPGNTGASTTLQFKIDSSDVMRILSTGNVGIGTTAPDARLEINHATGDNLRLTYNDADGGASAYTDFSLASDGDLTIDSAGGAINLGAGDDLNLTAATNLIFGGTTSLGETTAADDSGAYLVGTFDEFDYSDSANVQGVLNDIDSTIAGIIGGTTGLWTDSGTITYLTSTADDFAIGGTTLAASMFAIDESAGNFYFGYDNSASPTLLFEATDGDAGTFGFNTNDSFYFSDASVGIGTTAPGTKLAVRGTTTEATYGSDLVLNGDFATGDFTSWTAGANWSVVSNAALHTAGSVETLAQDISVTNATTYQIEWTDTGGSAGTYTFSIGGVTSRAYNYWESSAGKRTTIVASGTGSQSFAITPSSTYNGSLDNITVRPVTAWPSAVARIENSDGTTGVDIRAGGTGLNNTAVGLGSLVRNTTGYANAALGMNSLYANTTGYQNTALGASSLYANTIGYNNTALGASSLYANTIGYNNTALGMNSLRLNTTGYANAALGTNSLYANTTGYQNTALGTNSLYANTTGYYNTALGTNSLYANTTGYQNTALGTNSLYDITEGFQNTAVGYNTGRGITTGDNNTILGSNVTGLAADLSNNIIIADGAGNRRINVDSNGLVGIGTTTPAFPLDVQGATIRISNGSGSSNATLNLVGWNSGVSASSSIFADYLGGLNYNAVAFEHDWQINGSTKMIMNSSGNVGIGTTGPASQLHVLTSGGISKIQIGSSVAGGSSILQMHGGNPATTYNFAIATNSTVSNALEFIPSTTLGGTSFTTPVMIIQQSGNVGIGTTIPTDKLTLASSTSPSLRLGTADTDNGFYLGSVDSNEGILSFGADFAHTGGAVTTWTARETSAGILRGDNGELRYYADTGLTDGNAFTPTERFTILSSGYVGVGDSSPNSLFTVGSGDQFQVDTSGDVVKLKNLTYSWPSSHTTGGVLTNNGSGTLTWDTLGAASIADDSLDFDKFQDTMDLDDNLILNQAGYTWVQNFTGTTADGFTYNANSLTSGDAVNIFSTSTGLTTGSLLGIDWSPGSTTTATGDLFSLNIGANGTIGNLFNIKDAGSSLFSVSETAMTSNLPSSFTSAGDVSIAYDLIFTNPAASYVKSAAPLAIQAGETFGSSNLTLQTYNSGDVVVDSPGGVTLNQAQAWDLADASITSLNIESGLMNFDTTNSRIGIGTTGPDSKLDVLATSGEQLRLSYADGTIYSSFTVDGSGDLTISATGGDFNFTDTTNTLIAFKDQGVYPFLNLAGKTDTGDPVACDEGDIYYNAFDDTISICHSGSTWEQLDGGGTSLWTDAGTYLYPTDGEVLGNSASAGANKIAGIYLADSSPLYIGTDNDTNFSFSGTTLAITTGDNDINFDANTLFIDGSANNVGVGTTGPDAKLDVLATLGEQLRLTHTNESIYTGFTVDGDGYLYIDPTGSRTALDGSLQVGSVASAPLAYSRFGTGTTDHSGVITSGADLLLSGDLELDGNLYLDGGTIANYAGTASIVLSSAPVTTPNTLSASNWLIENTANVGQAALIVNNTKSADLFTASASGTTKFTVHNDGSITLASDISSTSNTLEGTIFYDNDSAGSSSTDHLFLRGSDSAWHRIALDMTKYTATNASVANGSYIEIAHNQATNDISTTGWIYDGSQYININQLTGRTDFDDPQLVGWWKTEEASGNLDNAEGTAANDLVASGSATYQQSGKLAYSIALDGTSDWFANVVNHDNFNVGSSSFSVGGWFKHDTIDTNADYAITKHSNEAAVNTGDGADGSVTISSSKNMNTQTIAGGRTYADGIAYRVIAPSDGASSVTRYSGSDTISNGLVAGDEVLLINLGGTSGDIADVGNHEIVQVDSVTSSTVTFTQGISNSYDGTVAGNQKVVIQRVPNYTDVTVSSGGIITASAWDGLATAPTGIAGYYTGIVTFRATGTVSVATGGSITTYALGYRGGAKGSGSAYGTQGESRPGTGTATSSANDGGGGGGSGFTSGNGGDGGGGGGYALAGTTGSIHGSGPAGTGGSSYGDAPLVDLFLGSGGGGGGSYLSNGGNGGRGGGIVFISADTIATTGGMSANGSNGANDTNSSGGGGGGSGGSIKLSGDILTLGSGVVTSTAGAGGTGFGGANGGAGSVGRIAVQYLTSVGTSSTPSYDSTQVTAGSGGYKLYMDSSGNWVFGIDDDETSFPEDSATTASDYDDNAWHHVVGVKDGTSAIKLYVDGQEVASDISIASTSNLTNPLPFYLGVDSDGSSNSWAGNVDEAFMYNRLLSPGEIEEIYQSNSKYQIIQTDTNTVRLYNNSGETQNLRLDAVAFGADLAEWYSVNDEAIQPGDLVALTGDTDSFGVPILRKSNKINDPGLVGAISTRAGQELGLEAPNRRLLGLAGRIPVKIDPNSPEIKAGDSLTSSEIPGVATKAMPGEITIGKAFENWKPNNNQPTILVLINNSQAPDPTTMSSGIYRFVFNTKQVLDETTQRVVTRIGAFSQVIAGIINTNKLISPEIETSYISPIADTDLIIDLDPESASGSSSLVIKGVEDKTVASIDAEGNATFSGELHATKIYADEIIARNGYFEDLKRATESAVTRDEIEDMLKGFEEEKDLLASAEGWDETQNPLLDIKSLSLESLFVTDLAAINSLSVSDSFYFGDDLIINETGINTLTSPLRIQPLAMAPIELMAGLIRIETNGDVIMGADLYVAGNVNSRSLSLVYDPEADPESTQSGIIKFYGQEGVETASINASGSAQFKNVSTDGLVIANPEGEEISYSIYGVEVSTNATAGKAIIPDGRDEITIKTPSVTDQTLVYITPTSDTNNKVLYLKEKGNGYFVVGFSSALNIDVSFNWWVINLKDAQN